MKMIQYTDTHCSHKKHPPPHPTPPPTTYTESHEAHTTPLIEAIYSFVLNCFSVLGCIFHYTLVIENITPVGGYITI